jgi:hypothetical protein
LNGKTGYEFLRIPIKKILTYLCWVLIGIGCLIYGFIVYAAQSFDDLLTPMSASHSTFKKYDLSSTYTNDSEWILQLSTNPRSSLTKIASAQPSKNNNERLSLGDIAYNNISIDEQYIYASIYREYTEKGFETGGQRVDVFDYSGNHVGTLHTDGYMPTDVFFYKNIIIVNMRHVKSKNAGFEIFEKHTFNKIGEIDLKESFPTRSVILDSENGRLYVFASSVGPLKDRSPYLSADVIDDPTVKKYEIFFNILLDPIEITEAKAFPSWSAGKGIMHDSSIIVSATYDHYQLYRFLPEKGAWKVLSKTPAGHLLRKSKFRNELYGLDWNGDIKIFDLTTFKLKKTLNFKATRDFIVRDNFLYLNTREHHKVIIYDLDKDIIVSEYQGAFGPFSLK